MQAKLFFIAEFESKIIKKSFDFSARLRGCHHSSSRLRGTISEDVFRGTSLANFDIFYSIHFVHLLYGFLLHHR